MKFNKPKSFRLSRKLTYILGKVSAITQRTEAEIIDRCLDRRIRSAVPEAARREAAAKALEEANQIKAELASKERTGKYSPRPRKFERRIMEIFTIACEKHKLTQAELLEHCLNVELAKVVEEFVQSSAEMAYASVPDAFAQQAIAAGVYPSDSNLLSTRSKRFKKSRTEFGKAVSLTRPQLSQVASGEVAVRGMGRITNAADGEL